MLLHVFPTYSHLYIYIYLPGIDPITIARRCLKHNFQGFRGWKVDEVMSQLLPFDAATDQLGPFGVGSKGSANNFVFFSNRKQKRMLNSNKFSDTHGRLDSCYSRYVALKKSVLGSQAWARRTPALWWWHIMWNDACDVSLGVGSNINDMDWMFFVFPGFLLKTISHDLFVVSHDFRVVSCCESNSDMTAWEWIFRWWVARTKSVEFSFSAGQNLLRSRYQQMGMSQN